ncbi:hypothetical protein DS834_02955 [Lactobacillus bombicola]|uniref:SHOCT domain-containing protein n=1 Tax=Lactobacillus bombicola TaxID=1505723 RepID=A0ABX9LX78_9LACO|nr:SHOCT domain-containing protein [Lactobacillus bombicola]RHW53092.1 hypothetical protein DS834_02955 [Lactobacillus bombicola]
MKICAICNKKIKGWSYPFKLKDAVICDDCARKVNLTPITGSEKVKLVAKESITLQEVKQYIDGNKKFDVKALKSKGEVLKNKQKETNGNCSICGKELGFWNIKNSVKDGVICENCLKENSFYANVDREEMDKFLATQTVTEVKNLIGNSEKLQNVKKKIAPKKHSLPPLSQCALCGQDIYRSDAYLKFKDSSYICENCRYKYKFTSISKSIDWASEHTIGDLKECINQGKDFNDISSEVDQQNEQRKQEIAAFKKKSVKYSHYYFNRTERKIYIGKTFLDPDRFVDADEITSYRVNEKGHDENKHHVFTRAAVGAIIAGPAGAVIAGTTGGKINEYIDHLGLIINLTDGSNFEVSLLNSKNNKADGFLVRHAYSDLNDVIAILDSWKATEKVVEDIQDSNDAPAEIRKYKQLLDDDIITQEEFDAKKKQLLGL